MAELVQKVATGRHFEFGKNWQHFLATLDSRRIDKAMDSLRSMLCVASLAGRSFLDVGSGSGLFSLAARKLGLAFIRSMTTRNRLPVRAS